MPLYRGSRRLILRRRVVAAGGGLDAATTAWVNAVVAAGGTVSGAQQTRVNTLIVSLKAASLFTVLDRLWLLASENTQQAGIDIISLNASLATVGSPSFTANLGYICDNISKYLNTNFVPSSAGGNYILNSASYGYYNLTTNVSPAGHAAMGINNGTASAQFRPNTGGGTSIFDINDVNFPSSGTTFSSQGMDVITRTAASGAGSSAVYRNSNGTAILTDTGASSSLPTFSFYINAFNNSGSSGGENSDQIAAAFTGGGLTSGQAANLSNAINAYMTAISVNVY